MKLGYACINKGLSEQSIKNRITTNRTFRKATFEEKGLPHASAIFLQNSKDLLKILQWNEQHNIKFFRLSSQIVSWATEYQLTDLPDYAEIEEVLFECGLFIEEHGMRVTSHPDHFVKLASPNEDVVRNSIRDLEIHGEIFDLLCLPRTHYAIVHDLHHHEFCTGGISNADALALAVDTWGDTTPVVHYSQSRAIEHNDTRIKAHAHSDSYWTPVDTYGHDVDVMLECKHKELGLFKMRELLGKTI